MQMQMQMQIRMRTRMLMGEGNLTRFLRVCLLPESFGCAALALALVLALVFGFWNKRGRKRVGLRVRMLGLLACSIS